MRWELWVDYQRTDGANLTQTNVRITEPGVAVEVGRFLVVGNEDAEPGAA